MQLSNLSLAKRAIRLYSNELVPKAVNRYNQKSWMRSVIWLGPRWILAIPVVRQA